MKTPVKTAKDGVVIALYVQPGASKSGWCGTMGDALKLRVGARPVEGEANKEVCSFIAGYLSVPKSAVTILHGASGRNKTIHVRGDTNVLVAKLTALRESGYE